VTLTSAYSVGARLVAYSRRAASALADAITALEMTVRRTSSAAEAVVAVWAATVEPRSPVPPTSIAPTEVSIERHIQFRRVSGVTAAVHVFISGCTGDIASRFRT
jgi:hypothetical protein